MTETTSNKGVETKTTAQIESNALDRQIDSSHVRSGDLGTRLKTCREQADLGLEQAAVEMKLAPALLQKLENEQFSELPDPPYVRGYLRSYARLNNSDPTPLIRTYEILRGGDPDTLGIGQHRRITAQRQVKPPMPPSTLKLIALVVLVLFLGLLSMIPSVSQWARQTWNDFATNQNAPHPALNQTETHPVVSELQREALEQGQTSGSTTGTLTPASSGTNPLEIALDPEADQAPAQNQHDSALPDSVVDSAMDEETHSTHHDADTEPNVTDSTENATQLATQLTTDNTPQSEAIQLASTDTNQSTPTAAPTPIPSPTPSPIPSVTPTPSPTTTPVPSSRQQPIDGNVRVRMEFTSDVWLQVRDGNNRVIFEALNDAYTWKEFSTHTPLSFRVGYAPGVRIYFNGQLFDQTPYTSSGVSRFTVN